MITLSAVLNRIICLQSRDGCCIQPKILNGFKSYDDSADPWDDNLRRRIQRCLWQYSCDQWIGDSWRSDNNFSDSNIGINFPIARSDELFTRFKLCRFGTNGQSRSFLGWLRLRNCESSCLNVIEITELNISFQISFILIKVGNCEIAFRARDKGEVSPFWLSSPVGWGVDHLIVDADGGGATALAGVYPITSGDADASGLIGGRLACYHNPLTAVRTSHHQKEILAGGCIGKGEAFVRRCGADVELVQEANLIILSFIRTAFNSMF